MSIMDTAEKSLQQLRQLFHQQREQPSKPRRNLQPRHESAETFSSASLPPQRNRTLRGKLPTFFLSRGENSSQLLKQSAYLKRINERVMGRLGLPYSAHIQLSAITSQGVAHFHADSPAWLSKGRFLQKQLLDLLHQEGATHVRQVTLKVRFRHTPEPTKPIPPKTPSRAIAAQLAQQGEQTDDTLGRSLKRLANTLQRNR